MLDILAIKADVYQLERQGKRLPGYRYLREVWQKKLATADELWRIAKICRMTNLMRPYFDSII